MLSWKKKDFWVVLNIYTEGDSKVGFWLRWLRRKFSSFARAL